MKRLRGVTQTLVGLIALGLVLSGCVQVLAGALEGAALDRRLSELSLEFNDRLQVSDVPIPLPVVDKPYEVRLWALGGKPPYQWSIVQGQLPPGLELANSSGTISGVAKQEWNEPIVVLLVDGSADARNYVLKSIRPR